MDKITKLEELVRGRYEAKDPNRADWADWLYADHVFVVGSVARNLARRFGANVDLSQAAAILHDIADTCMSRFDSSHEETSLNVARELMTEAGYADHEIRIVVDDAIRFHSCHDSNVPESLEGKILATADALAHLTTDFYLQYVWQTAGEKSLDDIRQSALKKLERDFGQKIQFEEIRQEVKPDYESLKQLFSANARSRYAI